MEPLILRNANFITFEKQTPAIQAILLNNGLVEKVYSKESLLPRNIKSVDLKDNYVLPGFIDSHTHLIARGIELQRIDLEKCTSLNDCLEKLRSALHEDSDILFGSNWDENSWERFETKLLTKQTLDTISKQKPIIMRRICGHFAVVNSKALSLIPKNWQNVNRKNGHLYENFAHNLNQIFKPSATMLEKAIALGTKEAMKKGITSVQEITNPRRFRFLQAAEKKNRLTIRFAVYLGLTHFHDVLQSGMSSGLGNDFLKFAGIKIYLDGSIGARTAAMRNPYKHWRTRGKILFSMHRLRSVLKAAENHSIQLMVHSIGDRATTEALKVFEKAGDTGNRLRHRLEHVEVVDNAAIRKMAQMNLIVSMQPNFVRRWQMPGGMYERYFAKRYRTMNCFKALLNAGIKVVFGSDCMPLGPLYGIRGAVEHPSPRERLTPLEALKMYTREAAYATFEENNKGTIRTGKYADLVVLNKNPLREKNLDTIKTIMVLVGGRIVYDTHT